MRSALGLPPRSALSRPTLPRSLESALLLTLASTRVTLLQNPLTVFVEEAEFPTRSASFTPRLGPSVSSPSNSTCAFNGTTNPLFGLLVPITSFLPPASLPRGWNDTVTLHACSLAHGKHSKKDDGSESVLQVSSMGSAPPCVAASAPVIALALRGECSFAAKVRMAQELGASAVVIGDEALTGEPESIQRRRQNLITMFSPDDIDDLDIPAMFVSRATYLILWDELKASPNGTVAIRLEEDTEWEYPLLDLLLALLLLPSILTIATLGLNHIRTIRRRKKERATPSAVDALEVRIWQEGGWEKEDSLRSGSTTSSVGGDDGASRTSSRPGSIRNSLQPPPTHDQQQEASGSGWTSHGSPRPTARRLGSSADRLHRLLASSPAPSTSRSKPNLRPKQYYNTQECAICLEMFQKGDEVRICPCGHVFHREELDQWLMGWKRCCPVCKADITKPFPSHKRKGRFEPNVAPLPTETTPLLLASPTPAAVNDQLLVGREIAEDETTTPTTSDDSTTSHD